MEFYCLDKFSLDETANAVMLIRSGICDAVDVFSIMCRCVCEQTTASLRVTVAARTKVVSMSTWITGAIASPISRWKAVNKVRCAEKLLTVGMMHVETATVSTR